MSHQSSSLERARHWVESLGGNSVASWEVGLVDYRVHLRALDDRGLEIGTRCEEGSGPVTFFLEWSPELDSYFFGDLRSTYWDEEEFDERTEEVRARLWFCTDARDVGLNPRSRGGFLQILHEDYSQEDAVRDFVSQCPEDNWELGTFPYPALLPDMRVMLQTVLKLTQAKTECTHELLIQTMIRYFDESMFYISARIAYGFLK